MAEDGRQGERGGAVEIVKKSETEGQQELCRSRSTPLYLCTFLNIIKTNFLLSTSNIHVCVYVYLYM